MSFRDSYLGRLRQKVGSGLVLMPGAMVVVQRPTGHVLVTRRSDDDRWCLPAGAAEAGGSFASTALAELDEEVGLKVEADDLVAFGTLSDAALHTIEYPNGDLTHCFALLFLVRSWDGIPAPDGDEVVEVRFVNPSQLPAPMMPPGAKAIELLQRYVATGRFQLA